MTHTKKDSKRRLITPVMTAAFMLSSSLSLGKRSEGSGKRFNKTKLQQLIAIISMYGILISGIYTTAKILNEASADSPSATPAEQQTIKDALTAQVRGYEIVLKREPNNPTALEGLAKTKIQIQDYAGAIAPLENLVKQFPERSDYAAMLTEAKQKAAQK